MQQSRLIRMVTLAFSLLFVQSSYGAITLTIENAVFSPGAGGTLNVWISSNPNVMLSDLSFEFRVSAVGATATQLSFTAPQSDLQLNNANYVFATSSIKRDGDPVFGIPIEAVGTVSTSTFPNDTYIGFDGVAPSSPAGPVNLGTTNLLLATLELSAGNGLLAPVEGDAFRVELIASGFTQFFDQNGSTIAFSSSGGAISITAVPEPSGVFGILAFGSVAMLRRYVRRRRARRTKSAFA